MPDNRLLAIGDDNKLYLGEIYYHYNGLLSYISWKTMELDPGMEWYHFESSSFDTLGYSGDRSDWKASNFIPMDTIPEVLQPGAMKDPEKIKFMEETFVNPVRVWLPENNYTWKSNASLFFNLCGLYGFAGEEKYPVNILMVDARDRSIHEMEPDERKRIREILDQCFIEPQLDAPHKKHLWCSDSPVYFVIEENGSGKNFLLGYIDGRFIMKNNFYTFIFPEEKEPEFTEQMLRYIRKYTEPLPGSDPS